MKRSAPLPWEWFEFGGEPRALPAGGLGAVPEVEGEGAGTTWEIADGPRRTLLKILRVPRAAGEAEKKLLILLHGMGLSIATFRGVLPYLLPTHDIALVDYSGMGFPAMKIGRKASGWPRGSKNVRDMAGVVWKLADVLRVERVDLGGSSLGGGMCLVAALENLSRTGRLVLSNPACYPQELPRTYRWARVPLFGELFMAITHPKKFVAGVEYIGYVDKSRFDPDLRARYERHLAGRENRWRLMELMRALPGHAGDLAAAAHVGRLSELTAPVLVTWGEQDPLLVQGAGQRLAKDLPRATYLPFADLAHLPHEEAPERVGAAWAAFLNG